MASRSVVVFWNRADMSPGSLNGRSHPIACSRNARHEALLPLHAAEVHVVVVTEAHVVESVRPAQQLIPGLDVDGLVVPERVVVAVVDVHVHPAERVDDVGEGVEPDLHVVVDVDAGGLLDGLDGQSGTVEGEGGVQLALAVPGDIHPQVAGEREHRQIVLFGIDVDDHQSVGPATARGLLGTAVGADDQQVHGRGGGLLQGGRGLARGAHRGGRGGQRRGGLLLEDLQDLGSHPVVGGGHLGPEPEIGAGGDEHDHQDEGHGGPKNDPFPPAPWTPLYLVLRVSLSSQTSPDSRAASAEIPEPAANQQTPGLEAVARSTSAPRDRSFSSKRS